MSDYKAIDATAWASFLPSLLYCISSTVGPVLELGIGHFSTPCLNSICVPQERPLTSIESDLLWFNKFSTKYSSKYHRFVNDEYLKVARSLSNSKWSVVFIDNSPGGLVRGELFRMFIECSQFVVVHDYWKENEDSIKPRLNGINHKVYSEYEPPTLIASLYRTPPWIPE